MKRIDANRKILGIIAVEVEKNPDYRFIQILWAMDLINAENGNIKDRFYEESDVTFNKINYCHKAGTKKSSHRLEDEKIQKYLENFAKEYPETLKMDNSDEKMESSK